MQILAALIGLIGVIAIWQWRVRAARDAGNQIAEGVHDIRLAVRRLMHEKKYNRHPVDSVEDPRLAAAGVIVAVATMDAPISQREIEALRKAARETFEVTDREALDIVSFGRWIAGQCETNGEAVRRLSRVVQQRAGAEAAPDLIRIVTEVATADGNELGEQETDALDTVRRAFAAA